MKKLLFKLLLLLVLVLVGLYLGRNLLARIGVEAAVERVTGFPLVIGSVDVALLENRFEVRDTRLLNPADFGERLFVDLPRFSVDYEPTSFFTRTTHLHQITLDVRQLVIVKNRKGESNLARLRGASPASAPAASPASNAPVPMQSSVPPRHCRVDILRVKIGQVVYKDFTGAKPVETVQNLNFSATYRNITETGMINHLVLLTVFQRLGLPPDVGIAVDGLLRGLSGVTDAAGHLLKETGQTLKEGSKSLWEKVKPGAGAK